ncbi:uncharacterized protein SCHCODRAFT_02669949 [Schizophyllum commune H4-8]|uniref:uncharacterized protein n=1 Tax=Schizophyllum commune (strain H4-8 / FGSC 9210) TaxID=578458 RepID=UPI00215FACE6|nr:uncharacterized protein SCHCODRAFT_02669949 [Schizophyllum commune H4-8]KAI5890838.1 hypothetical protein SCHCODRAFT_02669949 [Schizophyllum commune H4-8]
MSFFRYSTPRVDSDANYWERPYALVDASWATSWSFRVEARIQHGRCRAIHGEIHETDLLLWTPNATTIPYFAGRYQGAPAPEEGGNPASCAADRARRQFDGHLGPDDGYEYPQYYDSARPWMCFVHRVMRELTETTASYTFFHPYYAQMDQDEVKKQRLPESLIKRFKQEEEQLERQEKEAVVALDTFCSFLRYAVEPPPRCYSAC